MARTKRELEAALPFAMEPVVYDFAINERGTWAELLAAGMLREGQGDTENVAASPRRPVTVSSAPLMPPGYYALTVPELVRLDRRQLLPRAAGRAESFRRGLPYAAGTQRHGADPVRSAVAKRRRTKAPRRAEPSGPWSRFWIENGFDRVQHEQIRADLRSGRIGLAQNRLPANSDIRDVSRATCSTQPTCPRFPPASTSLEQRRWQRAGLDALAAGAVAVITLAGGVGSRWTQGAGVVKALHPFCRLGGRHRTFIEVHLAKSRRIGRLCGRPIPHVITTSYLTHAPIEAFLAARRIRWGAPTATRGRSTFRPAGPSGCA